MNFVVTCITLIFLGSPQSLRPKKILVNCRFNYCMNNIRGSAVFSAEKYANLNGFKRYQL